MTDYTDLKARLQFFASGDGTVAATAVKSLAAIEALEAEVARLRDAIGYLVGDMVAADMEDFASIAIARAALTTSG